MLHRDVSTSSLEGLRLIPDHEVVNVFLVIIAFVDPNVFCVKTNNHRQT